MLFSLPPNKMEIQLKLCSHFLFFLIIISSGVNLSDSSRIFTIINNCKETIWPAVTGENFNGDGFALKSGQSMVFNAPVGWTSGRIWGRTGCNFDKDGNGPCQTGACGTTLKCNASGKPPISLAEFTLGNLDYYDISLVDGFNLPITLTPVNGKGNCSVTGCDKDLRLDCPPELAAKSNGKVVGCRSACDAFNTDAYCCKGNFGNAVTCQASFYSNKFKDACPTSYSYAYDDPSSIRTCSGTDYVVSFCSSRTQSVCTYHNNKLICSGSKGLNSLLGRLWPLMLASLFIVHLWLFFN